MNTKDIRLCANLFGVPMTLVVSALIADQYVTDLAKYPLGAQLANFLSLGLAAVWLVSAGLVAYGALRLWLAFRGIGELCHVCGAPTRYVDPGRYSPHYRCLRCGINRNAQA